MDFQTSPQLQLAFDFVQYTNQNIFLTGKAGTGKTTFLHNLKKVSPKRMVVVAPTGVAAINAGGVTIHSFFQMPFCPQIPKDYNLRQTEVEPTEIKHFSREKINIIRSLDLLVIDEISMVRADLLDAIDDVLRKFKNRNIPFGGVQLLMIGDLQQLAPVVKDDEWSLLGKYYDTCYFFSSRALRNSGFVGIELTHIYRQSNQEFISLLNRIRHNETDESTLETLNKRYIPDFVSDEKDGYIILTTHNFQAKQINETRLEKLKFKPHFFEATVKRDFPEYAYPADFNLILKEGAQVMFIKNDTSHEKRFYNGKIGEVIGFDEETIEVRCPDDDESIMVERAEWENCRYKLNEITKEIEEEVIGSFEQYPLKLAWAITIHKSQGLTFEKAIIDARNSFAHGQVYVAISRCKTLEGLVLMTPIAAFSVKNDSTVLQFTDEVEQHQPGTSELNDARKQYELQLLLELFNFQTQINRQRQLVRLCNEHSFQLIGNYNEKMSMLSDAMNEISEVAERFCKQLKQLFRQTSNSENDAIISERIKKAAFYFHEKLCNSIINNLLKTTFDTDNKELKKNIGEITSKLTKEFAVKQACLKSLTNGFEMKHFLQERATAAIELPAKSGFKDEEQSMPHFILYNRLKEWRQEKAFLQHVDINKILRQKVLWEISVTLPKTKENLKSIKGLSEKKLKQYGKEILELVNEYCDEKGIKN
ncbi:MAG: AAA family ATPase [Lentimicrobiaceae bacterium]|nr:AAA family ATPase [Lentimicrobiaceae bacterium]